MKELNERLADRLSAIKARLHKERDSSLSSHDVLGPVADTNDFPTDPNFGWHLDTINIFGAWEDYTGTGVTVGIIDEGINYNHVDLDGNYNTAIDWDARDNDNDAFSSTSSDDHGTKVAGVIAAEANGTGAVGVAYDAEIAGFRIGYGSAGSIYDIEEAITKAWAVSDVVNSSWGYSTAFQDSFKKFGYSQAGQALEDGVAQGRDGLGTVFVFSAGNERSSGQDVNYHNFQNSPYTIAVAATTSSGSVASFSNPGAALLVAAPGSSIQTTSSGGGYTSSSGTSFAAPVVSGVVALMLEANSELGYRDVQEILAYSADYNDATNSDWQFNGADNWNGGGLHFNHNFGFGEVNATGAVRLAETWTMQHTFDNQSNVSKSSSPNAAIPDGNSGGVSDTIRITQDMDIDTVQVDLQIDHTKVGDLVVVLVSPDGTEAVLANRPGGSGNTANNINFEFSANSFWGESPVGDWTLKVYDKASGEVGTFKSWTLTLNGDAVSNDETYIYSDDYAALTDASRSTLSDDNGGVDTINAAQVSGDSFIDLNAGTTSTLGGAPLVIAANTSIENLFLGDGNDTAVGNAADNLILGGRGDDLLDGGAGTDTGKFFGSLDNFNVTVVDASTITVTFSAVDGIDEGTDTLENFELFDFDGVVYTFDQLAEMYGAPPSNDAPVVANPISDQAASEDAAFSFALPSGTFTDVDGDTLALTATLSDGSALPDWLSFDADTGTFSGTPAQSDVGELDIRVTATDPSGAKTSDIFRVSVGGTNDAPVVASPISDQAASEDAAFSFALPSGTFTDVDGDTLALTATLSDGSALPDWLSFDADTGTFSGTPAQSDVGELDIRVTAADPSGAKTSDIFRVSVGGTNDAPVVASSISDQAASEDAAFSFALPSGTFTDVDGDTLALTATLSDGSALPDWLSFDADTGTFSGTPAQSDVGELDIRVTAADPSGAKTSDIFRVSVGGTNDAPVVASPISDQAASEDAAFSFALPSGTFTDVDGDTLALTATLSDGSALPDWLSFDADTGTFSGTPAQSDVGELDIRVTATDPSGAKTSDIFRVSVGGTNDAPVVASPISDQAASEDAAFSFALPSGTFTDVDGDTLALTATLSDGSALPDWLSFDADTGTFSGTPAQSDVGELDIRVTATDPSGAKTSDIFRVSVGGTNDAPVVASPISDQAASEDAAFSFALPSGTFTDVDGDTLALTATLSDGSALPDWLSFDADTGTFSGTPAQSDVGELDIRVTATDPSGAKTSDIFRVSVGGTNDAPVVASPISDQTVRTDATLDFVLAPDTFTDEDVDDQLTLTATLSDGSALPDWLSFDADTGTFSGTPAFDDQGKVSVTVTATDLAGVTASTSFDISVLNGNRAPGVSSGNAEGKANGTKLLTALFTVQDADGDSVTKVDLGSNGGATGHWEHNGTAVSGIVSLPDGDMSGLVWVIGDATTTEEVGLRVFDGKEWSDWATANVVATPDNADQPDIMVVDVTAAPDAEVSGGDLFAFLGSGEFIGETTIQAWASPSATGQWAIGGVPASNGVELSLAEFSALSWQVGADGTNEEVWLRVDNGTGWGEWLAATVTGDASTNQAPLIEAVDATVNVGEAVMASDLFEVSDADGDAMTEYEIWSGSVDTGHWELAGVEIDPSGGISADQFDDLAWVGGDANTVEDIWIRANDGTDWSDWTMADVTVDVVGTPNEIDNLI